MVVDKVGLRKNPYMRRDFELRSASDSVEPGPVHLVPRGYKRMGDRDRDRIFWTRCRCQPKGSEGRPQIQSRSGEMPVRKLRSGGEGLGKHVRRHGQFVGWRDDSGIDELDDDGSDLLLQRGRQQVGLQHFGTADHTVIAAERKPAAQDDSTLCVKACLIQPERRGIEVGKSRKAS